MKVLIVTLHYLNGVGGGVFASRAFINAFAALYPGAVSLLYPCTPSHQAEGIDPSVRMLPYSNTKSKLAKACDLLTGHTSVFEKVFPEVIAEVRPDLVVFDNSRCSFRLIDQAKRAGAKVVTIHHNCEMEYNRDNSSALIRPILLHWTERYEGEAVNKSHLNLTLTSADEQLLRRKYAPERGDVRFSVCGTFESAACELPERKAGECSAAPRFIITGNMSAKQTVESVVPWIETYFPILKEEFPGCELTLAGKNPAEAIRTVAAEKGIRVVANPESMNPLLEGADFYICPTSLGGGLKLRVMDGLKFGLPVICHKVSARGYEAFEQADCLFSYSDEASFRQACRKLKAHICKPEEVRRAYTSRFSFPAGCTRIGEAVSAIMASGE